MPTIILETVIKAPLQVCFDLARSIDLHKKLAKHSGEEAIAGVTEGLIGLNEFVTWRAKHFGIKQNLSTVISAFESPFYFRDEQIKGAFKKMVHHHYFEKRGVYTLMKDRFYFEAPLGILGKLFNFFVLKRYMKNFLVTRNNILKAYAEACLNP